MKNFHFYTILRIWAPLVVPDSTTFHFNPEFVNLKANKCVTRSLADRPSLWSSPASQQTVKEQSTHVEGGGGGVIVLHIKMVSHLCSRFFFFAVWTNVKQFPPNLFCLCWKPFLLILSSAIENLSYWIQIRALKFVRIRNLEFWIRIRVLNQCFRFVILSGWRWNGR